MSLIIQTTHDEDTALKPKFVIRSVEMTLVITRLNCTLQQQSTSNDCVSVQAQTGVREGDLASD